MGGIQQTRAKLLRLQADRLDALAEEARAKREAEVASDGPASEEEDSAPESSSEEADAEAPGGGQAAAPPPDVVAEAPREARGQVAAPPPDVVAEAPREARGQVAAPPPVAPKRRGRPSTVFVPAGECRACVYRALGLKGGPQHTTCR